ncbi:MAG: HAD family hydrolase [Firmicutes bacterium]|nr:HAD family hydrolase [Bacillota bacterium]
MHKTIGIIALDLDGTLLNSQKELSEQNRHALEMAAKAGWEIVPTTGRFYGGMPEAIRELPFVRYVITINGAQAADLGTGEIIYTAELPCQQAIDIMSFLDRYPVIYDCYQTNDAFMTAALKEKINEMASSPHYRKMLHELRKPVPELKAFLRDRNLGVQKVQFFTNKPELRLQLMKELPQRFENLCVSSSVIDNVEINQHHANKGEALQALAKHLGLRREQTIAFGDGLNDLSMLQQAGIGIAMENACAEAKAVADWLAPSCDDNGVAEGIKKFCLN